MMIRLLADYIAVRLGREEGATAVEYGVMVALIIAVIVGTVAAIGTSIAGGFNTTCDALNAGNIACS